MARDYYQRKIDQRLSDCVRDRSLSVFLQMAHNTRYPVYSNMDQAVLLYKVLAN